GGNEFGGIVTIGGGTASGPAIVVGQGTNSLAAKPITGGSVNVLFDQYDPFTPTNPTSILDQRFPNTPSSYVAHGQAGNTTINETGTLVQFSNSITALTTTANLLVGDSVSGAGIPSGTVITAINSGTAITVSNVATASGMSNLTFIGVSSGNITDAAAGTPNVPVTTNFTANVNINSPAFTTVSNLTVMLKIVHPHLDQVRMTLIAPDGTAFTLLQNHVNADGSTNTNIGLNSGVNLGIYNGVDAGTFLDDGATRLLIDPTNKDPHLGIYVPNYGFGEPKFSQGLDGMLPTSPRINGTWTLSITDFRNDGTTAPVQFVQDWSLDFTSNLDTGL